MTMISKKKKKPVMEARPSSVPIDSCSLSGYQRRYTARSAAEIRSFNNSHSAAPNFSRPMARVAFKASKSLAQSSVKPKKDVYPGNNRASSRSRRWSHHRSICCRKAAKTLRWTERWSYRVPVYNRLDQPRGANDIRVLFYYATTTWSRLLRFSQLTSMAASLLNTVLP